MNAGILVTPIKIYAKDRRKTPSGYEQESDRLIYSVRAYIRKQMQSYDKDGVQAMEQFFGETIVFKVRTAKVLAEAVELEYKHKRYTIVSQQEMYDRTTLLICKRKDS